MNDEIYNEENTSVSEQGQDENTPQNNGENKIVKEAISWAKTIIAALIFAFIITTFIIVNAKVPSGSMKNTINEGDRLIANRLAYTFSDPERFDIVVFKYPDDESVYYIKRIIGLPGETVEIKDGKVYIDGSDEPLDDSFILEPMLPEEDAVYEVPEGCYFMLGDNRNNSADSRRWNKKYVEKSKILGKAIFKYYPNFELLTEK